MIAIKSWLWCIFLIIISNIFFVLIYIYFQIDGNSSCGSQIACSTVKFISHYVGILLLILFLFFGLLYKNEENKNIVQKIIITTDLLLLGVIMLTSFFGKTTVGIKFQNSNTYCYFNTNKIERSDCLYFNRAVTEENSSECDKLINEARRFSCRDKIKWNKFDKCNTIENIKAGINCWPDKKTN